MAYPAHDAVSANVQAPAAAIKAPQTPACPKPHLHMLLHATGSQGPAYTAPPAVQHTATLPPRPCTPSQALPNTLSLLRNLYTSSRGIATQTQYPRQTTHSARMPRSDDGGSHCSTHNHSTHLSPHKARQGQCRAVPAYRVGGCSNMKTLGMRHDDISAGSTAAGFIAMASTGLPCVRDGGPQTATPPATAPAVVCGTNPAGSGITCQVTAPG